MIDRNRRVARWRLGLLVRAIRIPEVERLAFDERGHLFVLFYLSCSILQFYLSLQ